MLLAQKPSGTVRGQITDPSGAAVPSATVTAVSAHGQLKAGVVRSDGSYEITGLAPGKYTVRARAKDFALFEQQNISVAAGQPRRIDIALKIAQEVQEVQVYEEASKLSVSPSDSRSMVIQGQDLDALSDDPDEMQSELDALAGPAAGPNGGEIYVDGFSGGQLPPKADILEVRINRNPFSAENDKPGFGMIEITTRPGSSKLHGQIFTDFNDSAFNSRDPFAVQEPAYHSEFIMGSVGGPLGRKASFYLSLFRRSTDESAVVSAFVLSPTLSQTSLSQAVASPNHLTNLGPRFDYQLGANNVLTVQYHLLDSNAANSGIGQLNLASQGVNTSSTSHTLQLSDTQVFSAKTLNKFHFQYIHTDSTSTAQSFAPSVSVLGAFTGGGNSSGTSQDVQSHYEAQNLTSFFWGKHTLIVGGRLRDATDSNHSNANFNGAFTFASLAAYQTAELALQACAQAAGGACQTSGATQFIMGAGNPLASVNLFDVGLFVQDDWKLDATKVLSVGLRWEAQNDIPDHSDFAPRLGFAWGLRQKKGSAPKTVLRAGFGIFYDRFAQALLLQAERLNGTNQQQYIVPSPDFFPLIPSLGSLSSYANTPTRYQVDAHLRAPYMMQSAVSIERQLAKSGNVTIRYNYSHGVHQILANDINAPADFPLGQPQLGTRPLGNSAGNVYDYQSTGLFNQNQVMAYFNLRYKKKFTGFGFYSLGYADADTTGNSAAMVMNPYNIRQSYGRAGFDVRSRMLLGGNWNLPHRVQVSPFLYASSGTPLNVTVGQDLFGTGSFNARPAFAAAGATGANIVATSMGTFNTQPLNAGSIIPINNFDNPGEFTLNLRLSKTIGFGKVPEGNTNNAGGSGGFFGGPLASGSSNAKRYNVTLMAGARNVFNQVNLGPRVGVIGSPLFGQSNSLGGFFGGPYNRRIDLEASFSF